MVWDIDVVAGGLARSIAAPEYARVRRRMSGPIARGLQVIADLAWPVTCVGCGQWSEQAWCPTCQLTSESPVVERVLRPSGLHVYAATAYEGAMAHAITAFKDQGRRDCQPRMVYLLRKACAQAVLEAPGNIVRWFVIPVPSSAAAIRRRGFAPMEVLTQNLVPGAVRRGPALHVVRRVEDQSHLGRLRRASNVSGAFALTTSVHLPSGSGVLLIDDVVTSGATLNAAFAAIGGLKAEYVVGATIASTALKMGKET